jgi:hypothetical protein
LEKEVPDYKHKCIKFNKENYRDNITELKNLVNNNILENNQTKIKTTEYLDNLLDAFTNAIDQIWDMQIKINMNDTWLDDIPDKIIKDNKLNVNFFKALNRKINNNDIKEYSDDIDKFNDNIQLLKNLTTDNNTLIKIDKFNNAFLTAFGYN